MILGAFAEIHLGHKSLMNDFFYVNPEMVKDFGIESTFLRPIYRLQDLDSGRYWQEREPSVWLFHCTDEPNDLAGTGAGRYIAWSARQETRGKKQAAGVTTWKDALAKQGGRRWYHPKDAVRPSRIALRKAVSRQYAPYLFKSPTLLDQRLYTIRARVGVDEQILIAYLSSSLFPLALEVNADLGLGAGALTLGTDSLRELPCVDLAAISCSEYVPDIRNRLDQLTSKPPPTLEQYKSSELIMRLDETLLNALGFEKSRANEVASDLVRLGNARLKLAGARTKAKRETSELNVASVANGIAERLGSWLSVRRWPESAYDSTDQRERLVFPPEHLEIQTDPLLTSCGLRMLAGRGRLVFDSEYELSTAEVIVRAIQLGRRAFEVPLDEGEALNALDSLDELKLELKAELDRLVDEAGVGFRYEGDVRKKVLDGLALCLVDLARTFSGTLRWSAPALK